MAKTLKSHRPVGEDYLATAKQSSAVHAFPFPAATVWEALLDPDAWTVWLPITKVVWTSRQPFGVGTTRTVEIGKEIVEETFFAWEDNHRMAFRFERSSLPISAAVEDYLIVPNDNGCELRWSGKASAIFPLGMLVTAQLTRGIREGLPQLEAHIANKLKGGVS